MFMDAAVGDFRLQSNSPCINAGRNASAPAGPDLAGNPRIVGGTVDIGAYEFQSPQSTVSYAWLQQYGFPTDGSADFADPDGDGLNNWMEWRAGTHPLGADSVLRMLPPTKIVFAYVVSWQAVSNRSYFLQRSTNLIAFETIATNVLGEAGIAEFWDTKARALEDRPFFYRVGVNE
jgi:hypothetical protein